MKKILIFALILLIFSISRAIGQTDLTFEFQAYPTGLVPGLRLEWGLGEHRTLHLRAGYNWIRHRDLGVQDWESGSGFGGTLGYRHYWLSGREGFFLGARTDLWRNTIEWEDRDINDQVLTTGTSKILVVQPTMETGFQFVSETGLIFTPTLAFGYEINVKTEGEPVGEGAILLLGFQLGKRF